MSNVPNDLLERMKITQCCDPIIDGMLGAAVAEIERLKKENFAFAAGLCPHHYGDEYGHSGCREIDRLREQLEKANACLRQIIEADDEFRMGLPDDWEGDPLSDAVMAAKYLMAETDEQGKS